MRVQIGTQNVREQHAHYLLPDDISIEEAVKRITKAVDFEGKPSWAVADNHDLEISLAEKWDFWPSSSAPEGWLSLEEDPDGPYYIIL